MIELNKITSKLIDLILKEKRREVPEKKLVPAYIYNIVLHNTDTIVGICDARIGYNENIFYGGHIGFSVLPEYRCKGYATMAVELLKNVFKAHDMNKVYITNSFDNLASIKVCQKVGAQFLGLFELPKDNVQRIEEDETHKNVWELTI